MIPMEALAAVGGHVKPGGWRPFVRPEGWCERPWRATEHLQRRCRERSIPAAVVRALIERVDLVMPLPDGRMRLGLSRRATSRVEHDALFAGAAARRLSRLTLVVGTDGAVITGWYGPARRHRPRLGEEGEPGTARMRTGRH
jgi:hypothetical protein